MSLPAVEQVRIRFPNAYIAVLARSWVADLYRRPLIDDVIIDNTRADWKDLWKRWRLANLLQAQRFDTAILLPNSFDSALVTWMARIPVRIGYNIKRRGCLLTHAIPLPERSEKTSHQNYYYLELLRRSGILTSVPVLGEIRFPEASKFALAGQDRLPGIWIGISPGAANGTAKIWAAERFIEAGALAAMRLGANVAVFGSPHERVVCEQVATAIEVRGISVKNFAGETTLEDFLELVAGCAGMITNDSGSMHVASALGIPVVAVFGPTCPKTTGPTGRMASVIQQPVECSPCFLHYCPIDHRCMTRVQAPDVADQLIQIIRTNNP